jgi:hypothetical protein
MPSVREATPRMPTEFEPMVSSIVDVLSQRYSEVAGADTAIVEGHSVVLFRYFSESIFRKSEA